MNTELAGTSVQGITLLSQVFDATTWYRIGMDSERMPIARENWFVLAAIRLCWWISSIDDICRGQLPTLHLCSARYSKDG